LTRHIVPERRVRRTANNVAYWQIVLQNSQNAVRLIFREETIFRFRVPDGWIYTHTIIRFGSVDKNYVADTFVPDSKVDMDLPIHPTGDPRRDL
jgi:hypothetical protein